MVRENYVIPIAFAILSILDKKQLLRCKYSMVWMASASHLWRSVSVVFLASAVRGGFSPGITGQWTVLQPEEFEKDGSNSTKIHGKRKFIDLGLLLPMLSRGCRFCIQASTLKREFTEALNTPLGKPLWGSTLLPIKNQHLTSKTNFAITSKPREPHPQPLAPHDRGTKPRHVLPFDDRRWVWSTPPSAAASAQHQGLHTVVSLRQGLQRRLLKAVSPHGISSQQAAKA